MPSRRALLGGLGTGFAAGLAGCANVPAVTVPRLDDQSCPPFDVHADRTVCSHTDEGSGGNPEGGIGVSVSPTTVARSAESVDQLSFRLDNRTDAPLRYDGSRWRLHRNAGIGWNERSVATPGFGEETVRPGGSVEWHGIDAWFRLGSGDRARAGLYAAVLPVYAGPQRVVAAFLFRIVG